MFHLETIHAFYFGSAAVRAVASIGYCGVSFFFVLSGFILVYTYTGRTTSLGSFWQARFARIYPALALALVVTAPMFFGFCLHAPANAAGFWGWPSRHLLVTSALCLTLLESWVPQAALAWNIPDWSLSAEAFFYFVFPFILPRFVRLSRAKLLAIVPVCWLIGLVCATGYVSLHPDGPVMNGDTFSPWINMLKFNPLMRLPEFLMGMATGLLFLKVKGKQKIAWPLILIALAAITAVVACSNWIPYPVIHTALLAPAFAMFIYGVALRPVGVGLLETRWMEALGEASYPFYLLHAFIIIQFFTGWQTGHPAHQTLLGLATWFLLTVAASVFVDRFVERPLRKLLRPRKKLPVAVLA
jgi:peptidoglycan/LPS O-acetylase OafA/YrhL